MDEIQLTLELSYSTRPLLESASVQKTLLRSVKPEATSVNSIHRHRHTTEGQANERYRD